MGENVVTLDLGEAIRKQAAVERERIAALMAALDELRAADLAVQDDSLSEAGEFLAMERLTAAEDAVLELVSAPGFRRHQMHLHHVLTDVAGGAA